MINNYTILIMLLLFMIIIVIGVIIYYKNIINNICNNEPEFYIYKGKIKGPTILIIGATHGNEPAGYFAIKEFMDKINSQEINLKKGLIIFVPMVNYCGLKLNSRLHPTVGDINRLYDDTTDNVLNKLIIKLSKGADFIIDFHEAFDFNLRVKKSMGSTISHTDTKTSVVIANEVVDNLNKNITKDFMKYGILPNKKKNGTFREYMDNLGKNYILVEITGQNNIQDIEVRKNQGLVVIHTVMTYFDMI